MFTNIQIFVFLCPWMLKRNLFENNRFVAVFLSLLFFQFIVQKQNVTKYIVLGLEKKFFKLEQENKS